MSESLAWRVELAVGAGAGLLGSSLMIWLGIVAFTSGDLSPGLAANLGISAMAALLLTVGTYLDRERPNGLLLIWITAAFLFVYGLALFWLWVPPSAMLGLTAGLLGMVNRGRSRYSWR